MKLKNTMLLLLSASIATVGACSAEPKVQSTEDSQAASQNPHAEAPQQPTEDVFAGQVVETMDAGTYTYVRVQNGDDEIWAAATKFDVAVGDDVVVPMEMEMRDFHSDTLNRDFPVIYFASAVTRAGDNPAPEMPPGHPPISGAPASHGSDGAAPVQIEPAPGGVTIDQIWAGKKALAGSTVTVRGRVVKFNGGILGTNWIHIQDGSGDASAGTHDITVTSPAMTAVGDVITVTGPVVVEQDFGAGYSYPVMIKDASIVVQ